ncbi:MAG: hypothetical protein LBH61_07400 [Dysgonamonadaceae bacterium]|nr:hypothetical protein [Dysgonamonadaceae bacterium]
MIKKFTAILLVFVVAGLLLASSVVMHHHHNRIPHFSLIEMNDQPVQPDDPCFPDGKENRGENRESCQLDQEIDAIYKAEEDCHCVLCCTSHGHDPLLLQAVLFFLPSEYFSTEAEQPRLQTPYIISYLSVAVTSGMGLRAPPVA